ncbi:Ras-related protein RABA5d [Raphanus sativus]|nr:Ras-related protein RABA5d [Raphanus sativus]
MLVGNKCDLESMRAVSVEEGKALAETQGLFFMETSALDSTNVKTAFDMVIRDIYTNVSRKQLNSETYKTQLSSNNRVSLVKDNNKGQGPQSSVRFLLLFFLMISFWFYLFIHLLLLSTK